MPGEAIANRRSADRMPRPPCETCRTNAFVSAVSRTDHVVSFRCAKCRGVFIMPSTRGTPEASLVLTEAESEQRQSMCPACLTIRGTAFKNAPQGEVRIVSYQCPECGCEWTASYPKRSAVGFAAVPPLR